MKKNFNDLISLESSSSDIKTPHGIRFLAMIMLIISHKCMEMEYNPISNRNEIAEKSSHPSSVIARASYLYTDIFLLLSGMLVTYSFIGRLQRSQNINILKELAIRYFRVMPPVAGLMIFGTFILPMLGSGPQWPMLIDDQVEICKKNWWRNFLMIHNWFGFENICMTHTHHVGTDFTLFVAGTILVTFLYRYPKRTTQLIIALSAISTAANFYVVYTREMTVYVLQRFE